MNLMPTAKKLLKALRTKDLRYTMSTKQFFGKEGEPHNYYTISKAEWDEEKCKYAHYEVYSTTSMVRIVLFLRDLWYKANDWELPTDQPLWNSIRAGFKEEN